MCVSAMAVSLAESQLMKLNGLFAVRKPVGITSADVIRKLKKRLYKDCQEKTICGGRRLRIGHGGTLDKNASGVLVIGIGKGTKQLTKYLKGNKRYIGCGCFGKATDTYDASGKITEEQGFDHITHQSFENMLQKFIGNLMQVPPIYSALKIDGQRMSSLVSQGIAVDPKPARPVEVHSIQCLEFHPPHFKIDVHCSGGFYIRSLIHDIGKDLMSCSHMSSLVRTQQGPFILSDHTLSLNECNLQNIQTSLERFHKMNLKDTVASR